MIPVRRLKQSITRIDFGLLIEELSEIYGVQLTDLSLITGITAKHLSYMKQGTEQDNQELNKAISLLDVYLMIAQKSPPTY